MAWRKLTEKPGGDEWASDKLLSQPELPRHAEPYWEIFSELDRDRKWTSHSLGMAGAARLPERVPLPIIRREARRLGFEGDELEEAVLVLRVVDDHYVSIYTKKEGDRIDKLAKKAARR